MLPLGSQCSGSSCAHTQGLAHMRACPPPLPAEVVEYSCGIAPELMGEVVENVSTGIDTFSLRQPLGVSPGVGLRGGGGRQQRLCFVRCAAQLGAVCCAPLLPA